MENGKMENLKEMENISIFMEKFIEEPLRTEKEKETDNYFTMMEVSM